MGSIAPVFGASLVPSQVQQTLQSNYLAFDGGANDFAQQYLPEIYEARSRKIWKQNLIWFP